MFAVDKNILISSCSRLMSSASHVSLAEDFEFKIEAEKLEKGVKSFDPFKQWKENELNPKTFNDFTIEWIFLCDLLNFSFWTDEEEQDGGDDDKSDNTNNTDVYFNGKIYKNYWSLPATLNKSKFLVNPKFYSKINLKEFDEIFNPKIPLKFKRIKLMNEAGKVLMENYDEKFKNFMESTGTFDAWNFINRLIKEFPSFKDFDEKNSVWFLKRAQILVADLWAASEGKLFNETIKDLTIFADYRIPQVLNSIGLIKYDKILQCKLREKKLIESKEESEIRAASIIACEKLKNLLNCCCNAVELDYYLWEYSQRVKDELDSVYPFHRTRSIYY